MTLVENAGLVPNRGKGSRRPVRANSSDGGGGRPAASGRDGGHLTSGYAR